MSGAIPLYSARVSMTVIFALGLGVALLFFGGESLVRGASRLASAAGISSLVVGLTVVAFGTSAPELLVSVEAAMKGQADVSLGNVLGSNIFNILFILGLSAIITPLLVHVKLISSDALIMIGASVLALIVALDGIIGRVDGVVLVCGLIVFTWYSIREGRKQGADVDQQLDVVMPTRVWENIGWIFFGLTLLVFGARVFLWGAVESARALGLSELVIGLTIVAAGTSLPEVATSVVAAVRGQRDIAIGNVVGSNIFNILCVLGISSLVKPITVAPAALTFDYPVMIAVAVACLPIFYTGLVISRWNGALFLFYYAAYALFLVLDASGHAVLPIYSQIMLAYIIPLTVVTIITLFSKELWLNRRRRVKVVS